MQLLFSFGQDMRIEKTLIQTLSSQLSSILMQLLFWFGQDMRIKKTLIQTLSSQLSSTLMQLLFSFDQDMRVEKTLSYELSLLNYHQLSYSFARALNVSLHYRRSIQITHVGQIWLQALRRQLNQLGTTVTTSCVSRFGISGFG